jgi:hypothetical protein
MEIAIGKKASAWIPVAMSLVALVLVLIQLGIHGFGIHGLEPERGQGAVANLWQLLMAAQIPIIAFFAFRWVRRGARWEAVTVLLVQAIAATAASVLPVFMFGWLRHTL